MPELTQARLQELLHYEPATGLFTSITRQGRRPPGKVLGSLNTNGHIQISIGRKLYLAHRLAWLYVHGHWPEAVIDHINRDKADNRLINLRSVSRSQNCENVARYPNNRSGYKGVSWRKDAGKWTAYIRHKKRQVHLGYFDSPEAASAAYRLAASLVHTCNPDALFSSVPSRT